MEGEEEEWVGTTRSVFYVSEVGWGCALCARLCTSLTFVRKLPQCFERGGDSGGETGDERYKRTTAIATLLLPYPPILRSAL